MTDNLAHVPVLPGLMRDGTEASIDEAMRQAHEDLPDIPGTVVMLYHWPLEQGIRHLRTLGYGDDAIALVRAHPDASSRRARIVLATRQPPEDVIDG